MGAKCRSGAAVGEKGRVEVLALRVAGTEL